MCNLRNGEIRSANCHRLRKHDAVKRRDGIVLFKINKLSKWENYTRWVFCARCARCLCLNGIMEEVLFVCVYLVQAKENVRKWDFLGISELSCVWCIFLFSSLVHTFLVHRQNHLYSVIRKKISTSCLPAVHLERRVYFIYTYICTFGN